MSVLRFYFLPFSCEIWMNCHHTKWIPVFNWNLLARNIEIFFEFLCEVTSCFPPLKQLCYFLSENTAVYNVFNWTFRKSCLCNSFSKEQVRTYQFTYLHIVLSVLHSSIPKFRLLYIAGLGLSTFFLIVLECLSSLDYVSFPLLEQLLKLKNISLSLYIQKILICSIEV